MVKIRTSIYYLFISLQYVDIYSNQNRELDVFARFFHNSIEGNEFDQNWFHIIKNIIVFY